MPSSFTASLRFEQQFTGENINLWGDKLNVVLAHADYAVAGWLTKPLVGDYTLMTANAGDDEARAAMIKFTGTGAFTVTVPSVSKAYDIWNACAGDLTVTTGAGTPALLKASEKVRLICDGTNVYRVASTDFGAQRITGVADPTGPQDAATKAYADALAFNANAGILPGQTGSAGRFLTTDGTTASWGILAGASQSTFADVRLTTSGGTLMGGIYSNPSGETGIINAAVQWRLKTTPNGDAFTAADAAPGVLTRLATITDLKSNNNFALNAAVIF